MTPRVKSVLKLHFDEGYSFTETADILGLTKGQVAGIVHRNRPKEVVGKLVSAKTMKKRK